MSSLVGSGSGDSIPSHPPTSPSLSDQSLARTPRDVRQTTAAAAGDAARGLGRSFPGHCLLAQAVKPGSARSGRNAVRICGQAASFATNGEVLCEPANGAQQSSLYTSSLLDRPSLAGARTSHRLESLDPKVGLQFDDPQRLGGDRSWAPELQLGRDAELPALGCGRFDIQPLEFRRAAPLARRKGLRGSQRNGFGGSPRARHDGPVRSAIEILGMNSWDMARITDGW